MYGISLPAPWRCCRKMEIDVNELEEEFHNLKDKDGKKIILYAAKGFKIKCAEVHMQIWSLVKYDTQVTIYIYNVAL